MIETKHVFKRFQDRVVLDDINVVFDSGKTNLIIGLSGSGKTVLMKCLVGLIEIDEGEILYNDRNFQNIKLEDKKLIRQEIGMLFQGAALFDSQSVEENVMFPLDIFTNMSAEEKAERVNFCLKRVNMTNSNSLFPSEISGGMKKRAAIARAIVLQPRYLFCDEPNSGLDPKTSIVIDNLIAEITQEFNITTVINTHDMNSVLEIGDKVTYINKGKIWWQGDKHNILHSGNKDLDDFVYASELTKKLRLIQ
ncbi:MAG: ATP-binding cassette domain-containing protein [Bacteroidota bacterium]|jgi:phospholipid/cholesterol/gamma-HCH transport system ATP-binding protein